MAAYLCGLQHPKLLCLASPNDPRYQLTNFHWNLRYSPSGPNPDLLYLSASASVGQCSNIPDRYSAVPFLRRNGLTSHRRRTCRFPPHDRAQAGHAAATLSHVSKRTRSGPRWLPAAVSIFWQRSSHAR